MPKKGATNGHQEMPDKKKNKPSKNRLPSLLKFIDAKDSPITYTSPNATIRSLISTSITSHDDFLSDFWEKKPAYLQGQWGSDKENGNGDEFSQKYFSRLFNTNMLKEIMSDNEFNLGDEIEAWTNTPDDKEPYEQEGNPSYEELRTLFEDDHMVLSLHHPQRFHKELWKLLDMFECYFGCLVDAEAQLTPNKSQCSPHQCNEEEIFILQLEGSLEWVLFSENVINKENFDESDAIAQHTLKSGDVLYIPKKTLYKSRIPSDSSTHSTHLVISTYLFHTWGDYLRTAVPKLLESVVNRDDTLQEGLPINFHQMNRGDFQKKVHEMLTTAVNNMKVDTDEIDEITAQFFVNRLPPHRSKNAPIGKMPTTGMKIRFAFPHHVLISKHEIQDPEESDSETEDGDEDDHDKYVFVYHSLKNDRTMHMDEEQSLPKPEGLRFEGDCHDALKKILDSRDIFTPISDLSCPKRYCLDMLIALWADGLLETADVGREG